LMEELVKRFSTSPNTTQQHFTSQPMMMVNIVQ